MGSARCRENNMIVARTAANSRNINRRGRERTATSRPSYIGLAWTSYDENIENKSESTQGQGPTKPKGSEWEWEFGGEVGREERLVYHRRRPESNVNASHQNIS